MNDPDQARAISFQWAPLSMTSDEKITYEWTAATEPSMTNTLITQESVIPEVTINYLDLGTIYWRVRATVDNLKYESRVQKLHVQKSQH